MRAFVVLVRLIVREFSMHEQMLINKVDKQQVPRPASTVSRASIQMVSFLRVEGPVNTHVQSNNKKSTCFYDILYVERATRLSLLSQPEFLSPPVA